MFATLLGSLPRPPLPPDASAEAILDAVVGAQADRGLEPLTDGGWPTDPLEPVASWRSVADRAGGAIVKAVIVGPYTGGAARGASIEPWRAMLAGLADAGCRMVEVAEPDAIRIGDDEAARSRFLRPPRPPARRTARRPGPAPLVGDHEWECGRRRPRDHPPTALCEPRGRPDRRTGQLAAGPRRAHASGASSAAWCRASADSDDGPEITGLGRRLRGLQRGSWPGPGRPAPPRPRSPRATGRRAMHKLQRLADGRPDRGPAARRAGRESRPPGRRQPQRGARSIRAARTASASPRTRLDSEPRRCHHRRTSHVHGPVGARTRRLQGRRGHLRARQHMPEEVLSVGEHIQLTVNGTERELDVEPRRLLVQAIREDLDLTGTHVGCDTSQCGACTVHVDGKAIKSCTMLAVQADGAEVTTIEGMADGDDPPPAAERLLGEARPAVRLLYPGHDHGRGGPAGPQRRPDGRRDPACHRRQHLPLHRLPEHRGGDPARGGDDARRGRPPRSARRGRTGR